MLVTSIKTSAKINVSVAPVVQLKPSIKNNKSNKGVSYNFGGLGGGAAQGGIVGTHVQDLAVHIVWVLLDQQYLTVQDSLLGYIVRMVNHYQELQQLSIVELQEYLRMA